MEHKDTLMAEYLLALYLASRGQLPQALRVAESSWEKRQRSLGLDETDTLTSQLFCAALSNALGDSSRATELAQDCWQRRCRVLGEDDPLTLLALWGLSLFLWQSGQGPRAEEMATRCLQFQCSEGGNVLCVGPCLVTLLCKATTMLQFAEQENTPPPVDVIAAMLEEELVLPAGVRSLDEYHTHLKVENAYETCRYLLSYCQHQFHALVARAHSQAQDAAAKPKSMEEIALPMLDISDVQVGQQLQSGGQSDIYEALLDGANVVVKFYRASVGLDVAECRELCREVMV